MVDLTGKVLCADQKSRFCIGTRRARLTEPWHATHRAMTRGAWYTALQQSPARNGTGRRRYTPPF